MKSISYEKNADGFNPSTFWEASYLNIDMCKLDSSQEDESRAQSADFSKAYSNLNPKQGWAINLA